MLVNVELINGNCAMVEADTVEEAELWARWHLGNRNVRSASIATVKQEAWFRAWDGIIQQVEWGDYQIVKREESTRME